MYFLQSVPTFILLSNFVVMICLFDQLPALLEYRLGAFFLYSHIQAYTKVVKSLFESPSIIWRLIFIYREVVRCT